MKQLTINRARKLGKDMNAKGVVILAFGDDGEFQAVGDRAMRAFEAERKADEGKAAVASDLRELLSAFIDAAVLPGHVVTDEQWERACLLCGRWCPPFVKGGKK